MAKRAVRNSSPGTALPASRSSTMWKFTDRKKRSNCLSSWESWRIFPASRPTACPVADRKFLEIDIDNFDDRLKAD